MTMFQFKKEIQNISVQRFNENQTDRMELSRERDARMACQMVELASYIINGSREKIEEASEKGRFGCSIYECSSSTKYTDEYRSIFLLRGPYHWASDVDFFASKGLITVLVMVQEALDPFEVFIKYDKMTMTHKIVAVWKTT